MADERIIINVGLLPLLFGRTLYGKCADCIVLIHGCEELMPADVPDLWCRVLHNPVSKNLYDRHPVLIPMVAELKYAPVREVFQRLCQEQEPNIITAEWLFTCLTQLVKLLDGCELAFWSKNPGKGVAKHHVWNVWLQCLGVVKKVDSGAQGENGSPGHPVKVARGAKLLHLGQGQQAFHLGNWPDAKPKLESYLSTASCLTCVINDPCCT